MTTQTFIDDNNSLVQYLPKWDLDRHPSAFMGTRHKAVSAGQTVSLTFHGTGIQVITTGESVERAGVPQTTYTIDGNFVQKVTQHLKAEGETDFNVTVFEKQDLPAGDHELVITNNNGTSPSTFWLDYF
ncbi:hypothetical protein C8Q80DRAFT_1114585, partial [Daedaleopsis nitida]